MKYSVNTYFYDMMDKPKDAIIIPEYFEQGSYESFIYMLKAMFNYGITSGVWYTGEKPGYDGIKNN